MWICPNCKEICDDDAEFCIMCGTRKPEDPFIKRGFMDLEDEDWEGAKILFERALSSDPESAMANLGMFMAENAISLESGIKERITNDKSGSLISSKYWKRFKRFAADDLKAKLESWETGSGSVKPESSVAEHDQTGFDVIMVDYGEEKIKVIKEIRDILGLGLAEGKALVESAPFER